MTPRDVAASLGFVTARPVYRLIHEGKLRATRIGTRLLIAPEAVEELIEASAVRAPTSTLLDLERLQA